MSAPASGSGSPPATMMPPGAPPASPPGRRSRRWIVPVVAAVVVVIVILAALFATGALHLGSSASNASYESFSQAEGVASGNAASVGGNPWFAAVGAGVATPTSVLEPVANFTSLLDSFGCTISWPHGEPTNLAVPSTPSNAATGTAAYWTFGFKNSTNALLIESVSLGIPSALLVANGSDCESVVAYLAPFPSTVLNSPAIVTAANQAGGAAFLGTYPNATRAWGAIGGIELGSLATTSPVWEVTYTSCTFPAYSGETGATFNATVAGLTGVVSNSSTETGDCGLTVPTTLVTPLGGALSAASAPAPARKAI